MIFFLRICVMVSPILHWKNSLSRKIFLAIYAITCDFSILLTPEKLLSGFFQMNEI